MKRQLKDRDIPSLFPANGKQEEIFHSLTPGAGIRVGKDGRKTFFALYYTPEGERRRHDFGEHTSSKGGKVEYSPELGMSLKDFESAYKVLRGDLVKGIYPKTKKEQKREEEERKKELALEVAIPCEQLPDDLRKVFPGGIIGGTVGALLADYLRNSPKVKKLKTRSYKNYKAVTQSYLSPVFSVPILKFGEDEVRDLLFKLSAKAPSAVPQAKNVLSGAFQYAREKPRSGIKSNPCQEVRLGIPRNQGDRYLKDPEIQTLLEILPKMKDQKAADVYTLVLASMCRPGEAAGIKAEDIISDNGERIWKITDPKNGKDFLIPLYGPIGEVINRRILQVGGKGPLFWRINPNDPYPRQLKDANKELRELSGIGDIRPHDFRRTGRTHISGLNVLDEVAEALLNHAKGGIRGNYNLYAYLPERKEALKLWHAKLANLQAGEIQEKAA
jgi:integrase